MFKHHYFVIVQIHQSYWQVESRYIFLYCRAAKLHKAICDKFADNKLAGIESISRLD